MVGSQSVAVKLNSGSANTIEISGNGTASAPDLDRIVVGGPPRPGALRPAAPGAHRSADRPRRTLRRGLRVRSRP